MILEDIIGHKRQEVETREHQTSLATVMQQARQAPAPRPFSVGERMALIAEVKRRSPSAGDIHAAVNPVEQALAYQRGGAAAISVLTDQQFFGGSLDDLAAVRAAVDLPVLCKDFFLTPYQIYEARARGADLILLIVAALDDFTLASLLGLVRSLGMTPLVEVHDQHDLARAIAIGAEVIGINNRDLRDFSVDILTTEYLAPLVPDEALVVSESGITNRADVERVQRAGARAVLVGETLMRSGDPAQTIQELLG